MIFIQLTNLSHGTPLKLRQNDVSFIGSEGDTTIVGLRDGSKFEVSENQDQVIELLDKAERLAQLPQPDYRSLDPLVRVVSLT